MKTPATGTVLLLIEKVPNAKNYISALFMLFLVLTTIR